QLLIFGARVVAVEGSYDQAYALCAQICAQRGWYNRNTGFNPFTREGKKTVSLEIWEQLGGAPPDWVVVPVGDGNILSGVWKGFRELRTAGLTDRAPRLLAVQATGSAAIAHAFEALRAQSPPPDWSRVTIAPVAASSVADSICVDHPPDGLAALRALVESEGAAVCVSDVDILAAVAELARQGGVFAEPAGAAAWGGLGQAGRGGLFQPGERVVCLLTGNGLKDVPAARRVAGEPVRVAPELGAVQRCLDRLGL
ncbi:MAG: pyridoxal-phosphate dependent enzyme, partial [Candidatus Marinimicrobia bacterium]|nr:pyridoxal-phosphate dependent enzyme [Candidatus Neomarinimicrobiota bacterium]